MSVSMSVSMSVCLCVCGGGGRGIKVPAGIHSSDLIVLEARLGRKFLLVAAADIVSNLSKRRLSNHLPSQQELSRLLGESETHTHTKKQ